MGWRRVVSRRERGEVWVVSYKYELSRQLAVLGLPRCGQHGVSVFAFCSLESADYFALRVCGSLLASEANEFVEL